MVTLPRSYWVARGYFLAGQYPVIPPGPENTDKLLALLDSGMRIFVDLTHENDTDYTGAALLPYDPTLQDVANSMGLTACYRRFQIVDESVPSKRSMRSILDFIDAAIAERKPVYVHCWGGRGRTGAVVGCWLARHGFANGEGVLAMIQKLRRNSATLNLPSPAHRIQRMFVINWNPGE